jgi:2-C-methyl-D-erythritol 4-phosphate cytidylyltransferase
VHDPNLPYFNEQIINSLIKEALTSGAACLANSNKRSGVLIKLKELNEKENLDEQFESNDISEYLNANYFAIGHMPQAFQYNVFKIMFDNVSNL